MTLTLPGGMLSGETRSTTVPEIVAEPVTVWDEATSTASVSVPLERTTRLPQDRSATEKGAKEEEPWTVPGLSRETWAPLGTVKEPLMTKEPL